MAGSTSAHREKHSRKPSGFGCGFAALRNIRAKAQALQALHARPAASNRAQRLECGVFSAAVRHSWIAHEKGCVAKRVKGGASDRRAARTRGLQNGNPRCSAAEPQPRGINHGSTRIHTDSERLDANCANCRECFEVRVDLRNSRLPPNRGYPWLRIRAEKQHSPGY